MIIAFLVAPSLNEFFFSSADWSLLFYADVFFMFSIPQLFKSQSNAENEIIIWQLISAWIQFWSNCLTQIAIFCMKLSSPWANAIRDSIWHEWQNKNEIFMYECIF